jgi:hypothetical protein
VASDQSKKTGLAKSVDTGTLDYTGFVGTLNAMVISFRDQASYTVENIATHANMDVAKRYFNDKVSKITS